MAWPWRRKSRRKLARIAIEGPIASGTRTRVLKALREVEQREFPALLLRIDSPGGTVGDSQEIHAALRRLRDRGCRVVASFGNISASGGVYVGVAAEKIVANPGSITGSIGVILRGNNLSRLLERIGGGQCRGEEQGQECGAQLHGLGVNSGSFLWRRAG